jgi:hypothetical protein
MQQEPQPNMVLMLLLRGIRVHWCEGNVRPHRQFLAMGDKFATAMELQFPRYAVGTSSVATEVNHSAARPFLCAENTT